MPQAFDSANWEVVKEPEPKANYGQYVSVGLYFAAIAAACYVGWRLLRIGVRTLAKEIAAGKAAGDRKE